MNRPFIAPAQWRDFWAGSKALGPLMPGSAVFGLAFGALVYVVGIDGWVGISASVTVVAGSSQFAAVDALRMNAPAIIAIITALLINARFALYSAALVPVYRDFPLRWKLGLAHLMTDQAAVVSIQQGPDWTDPVRRRWFILGGALPFVAVWVIGTVAGVVLGPIIPEAWQIGFILPLTFLALLVPTLRDKPALVAVGVSVITVVALREVPYGLNVLIGILAGIIVGSLVRPPREIDVDSEVTP